MLIGLALIALALALAGITGTPIAAMIVGAFLWSVFVVLRQRGENREALRRRPSDLRRAEDDDGEPGNPYDRAAGLNAWMRGGRS